jgi:hypothetical protein
MSGLPPPHHLLVLGSAVFSFLALTWLLARSFRLGRREYLSAPRGDARKGVAYAFGKGMLDKESVTLHKLTSVAGVVYHGAVFAAFFSVFVRILLPAGRSPPLVLRPVVLAGALVGIPLLLKRIFKVHLRRLSCPDDFFANLFVDVFLVTVFLETFFPAFESALFVLTSLLLIYVPLGKIRHCFFFFVTRAAFGLHLGRRGALPGSSNEVPS